MTDWFETLDERAWLRPDDEGGDEAAFLSRSLALRAGQKVLDAPCGAGRIAYHLAKAGMQVVGIDLKQRFVGRANKRFRQGGLPGHFEVRDLRHIEFVDEFDAVVNWDNSFGYFSDEENADVMRRFAAALHPGGRLVIDQWNREHILRNFRAQGVRDGVLVQSEWDDRTQRYTVRRITDGRADSRFSSSQRWYTPAQMRRLFGKVGLRVQAAYGSPGGDRYSRRSRRMILVGQKTR